MKSEVSQNPTCRISAHGKRKILLLT